MKIILHLALLVGFAVAMSYILFLLVGIDPVYSFPVAVLVNLVVYLSGRLTARLSH